MFAASFVLARYGRPHAALAFRVAASLALALTLFRPRWLHAVNQGVGRAVTVALLTAVYVVVIVPTRGALALFRVNALDATKAGSSSYWVERKSEGFTRDDFERMS